MTATILIVDDSELGSAIRELLGIEGFESLVAHNAMAGLQLAQQYLPNLILTDVLMPKMDGIEFIRRVHDLPGLANTPIIAMSASDYGAQAIAAGAVDFLIKPFEPSELLEKISWFLPK